MKAILLYLTKLPPPAKRDKIPVTAQKQKKTKKEIRKAIREQLQYLKRNISILGLPEQYNTIPLRKKQYKYLLVIQTLYDQQKYMYDKKVHSVEDRIKNQAG